MWDLVQRYTGRVGYQRGAKASSLETDPPVIDCSGWVALLLTEAMKAENAAAGEQVFRAADVAACNAWSDRIIQEIQARAPALLQGRDIMLRNLPRNATIGLNEGYFAWQENHPRPRGINHIVQVVRHPEDQAPLVSESYPAGQGGISLTPLADWLESKREFIQAGKAWAVDPFAMADPASRWVKQTRGAAP